MSFRDLINSDQPILIDFYADWCGPCKQVTPILERVKQEMADEVRVVKIDVDRNQAIAQKLQVRSIPTLMLFKAGELQWRAAGVQPFQEIKRQIEAVQ